MSRKVGITPRRKAIPKAQAITERLSLTPEEIVAVKAARERSVVGESTNQSSEARVGVGDLAQALVQAIETTRPPVKKTEATRVKNNPYYPTDGSTRSKLKKVHFQHGLEVNPEHLFNEDIDMLNMLKPGVYCSGHIRVTRRKDRGIDIDYPIKTASQRLRLVNQFGITSFTTLIKRLLDEKADPVKYKLPDDDDD